MIKGLIVFVDQLEEGFSNLVWVAGIEIMSTILNNGQLSLFRRSEKLDLFRLYLRTIWSVFRSLYFCKRESYW